MSFLSQNKKTRASLTIPKPILYVAKTLQLISNRLAVWFGVKLFSTPINFKTPKREVFMMESAQKKQLYIPHINKKIALLSYGYSQKKVLLVHGWSGRSTQLVAFADKLLEKGYMVISFDGPAHGQSEGKTTHLLEFLEVIKEIDTRMGPFESAIGHSFGGFCLMNAVANGFNIKSLVTIGASDMITDVLANFTDNLRLNPIISKKMKHYFDKKWQQDINVFSTSIQAQKVKIPVLVIHDSQDGDVFVSCAENIRLNLQNGTLLITHGLGHTKILRNQKVVNRVVTFIKQNS